jgi:hypothetical protein
MKAFSKNTIFILLNMSGLVLTAPSQTMPAPKQVWAKKVCSPGRVYADIPKESLNAFASGKKISLEEARFVFACW